MNVEHRAPDAKPRANRQQARKAAMVWRVRAGVTKRLFASAVIAVGLLLVTAVAAVATGRISYTIIWGDTLSEIAQSHGTDTETLAEVNGIDDPDLIITGDTLQIPSMEDAGASEQAGQSDGIYVVQDGDTLSGIAVKLGVTVEDLAAANQIDDPDLIVTGEKLVASGAEYAQVEETATPEPEATEEESAGSSDAESGTSASGTTGVELHLVAEGETLADIAQQYRVTKAQLLAANGHARDGIRQGMILKIPSGEEAGHVQLIGMPVATEQWPLVSEITATSLATKYWGAAVSTEQILDALARSENPHKGFRGDYQGMYGMTEDYGVYNEPLAEVIQEFGFQADAFYADGDRSALTQRIDAGTPVVAWVTYQLRDQKRSVIENESGRYSLVPEQHAVAVYGYDDTGVDVVDVSSGSYKHYEWEPFMRSWTRHFDGMGLAVAPAD